MKLLSAIVGLLMLAAVPVLAQSALVTGGDKGTQAPAGPAVAEILRSGNPDLTEAVIRDLISRLSDEEVRALLLQRLDAEAKRQTEAAVEDPMMGAQAMMVKTRTRLRDLVIASKDLPGAFPQAWGAFRDGRPVDVLFLILLGFTSLVVVGAAAEWLFHHLARAQSRAILASEPKNIIGKLLFPFCRLAIGLAGLLAFLIGALALFFILWQGHVPTRTVVITYLGVIVIARAVSMVLRFVLSPQAPNLRLVNFEDQAARLVYRRSVIITWIAVIGLFTLGLFRTFGVGGDVNLLMLILLSFVVMVLVVSTLQQARGAISADIRGPAEYAGRIRNIAATAWPHVTSVFAVGLFVVMSFQRLLEAELASGAGLGSLLIFVAIPHIDAAIERAARARQIEQDSGHEYGAVGVRAARIFIVVVAMFLLFRLWGIDLGEVARQSVGGRLAGALLDIAAILVIAYVLWELTRVWIGRAMAKEKGGGAGSDGDEGGMGESRLSTLLPLIGVTIQVTIGVVAVLAILSGMGVNIGPLLAGAGVLGLAVGFGAQTLVKDIVSGLFFLIDDAFRVGEYVDVGAVKGTVEKISLRSMRLRHHRGLLHTIPFGEISYLTNFSRDWVIMKLEFRVTYDTDVNKVKKIFKKIGKDMMEHEELGAGFLEPFKSQGVKSMQDSAMIVGAKFKTKPGAQFMIRKELYNRVQKAFSEAGIKFAHRRVAIDLPEGIDPESNHGKALSEAAAAAVAAEDAATASGQPKPA